MSGHPLNGDELPFNQHCQVVGRNRLRSPFRQKGPTEDSPFRQKESTEQAAK